MKLVAMSKLDYRLLKLIQPSLTLELLGLKVLAPQEEMMQCMWCQLQVLILGGREHRYRTMNHNHKYHRLGLEE